MTEMRSVPLCVQEATDQCVGYLTEQKFFEDTQSHESCAVEVLDEFFTARFIKGGEDEVMSEMTQEETAELINKIQTYSAINDLLNDGLIAEVEDGVFTLTEKGKQELGDKEL